MSHAAPVRAIAHQRIVRVQAGRPPLLHPIMLGPECTRPIVQRAPRPTTGRVRARSACRRGRREVDLADELRLELARFAVRRARSTRNRRYQQREHHRGAPRRYMRAPGYASAGCQHDVASTEGALASGRLLHGLRDLDDSARNCTLRASRPGSTARAIARSLETDAHHPGLSRDTVEVSPWPRSAACPSSPTRRPRARTAPSAGLLFSFEPSGLTRGAAAAICSSEPTARA